MKIADLKDWCIISPCFISRDPFFGSMTHDDEEDDDDDEYPGGFPHGGPDRDFRFGFSFGPGGMRFHDDFGINQFFREFDELFKEMGEFPARRFEMPSIEAIPPVMDEKREEHRGRSLRDSMLKFPDNHLPASSERKDGKDYPQPETFEDRLEDSRPSDLPLTPFKRPPNPFGKFEDTWKNFFLRKEDTVKEDKDLDSQVSSGGLDNILTPTEPKTKSYFKSVSVTKVTGPDGSVEEHRTVRDSQGNEETTVTRMKGEQTFITTTKKDSQGKEERTEKIVSMDDRDLAQFSETWGQNDISAFSDPFSSFSKLFRGLFSSR
ncbi:HCLS1-associated protein X-1 [Protopterus annectens]|uniref:HCLS1-associated protein X-1 n=1 Tax=Protopterus annectens TaxID=7888 RepID=UPI001CFBF0D9|nr:HCLS1-associated protein X-1 [Protopterus annectens]